MLYVVTNRKLVKDENLTPILEKAIESGVDGIILREKDLSYEELMPIARVCQQMIERYNSRTRLIVNGHLKVAKDINAWGYHMSYNDFMEMQPDFEGTIGVSVHSIEEAVKAEEKGADYLLAGHVFQTDCKKGLKPRGIAFIKGIRSKVEIPLIAIGGITPEKIKEVREAGANGVAIMSPFMLGQGDKFLDVL
jgi:thiamine-phosphate pyrophosphorylase